MRKPKKQKKPLNDLNRSLTPFDPDEMLIPGQAAQDSGMMLPTPFRDNCAHHSGMMLPTIPE